jgi:hypothetical protein
MISVAALAPGAARAQEPPPPAAAPIAPPPPPPPTTDEAAIRKALEADAAAQHTPPAPAGTEARTQLSTDVSPDLSAQAGVRAAGTALLNPNLSVIVDGSFGYYGVHRADFAAVGIPESGDDPSTGKEGFTLQEVELAFQTAIDPYLEGAVFLTIPNLEGVEVEEAYFSTTSLPLNLQVKGGSFRSQLGRNNTQHLHLQNFTRRPLMTPLLFGADGFRGPGLQLSVLLPRLPWFATLYAEAFSIGAPEEPGAVASFGGGRRSPKNLTYTAVLEQFWPVSDATSLMLGLNFATGIASLCAMPPCDGGPRDYLYGADLYFKWRPQDAVGERLSLRWTTEYFARKLTQGGPTEGALYTEPVLQLARRWYLGARFDLTGVPKGDYVPRRYGVAASVTFAPTEFSRFRLYGQTLSGPGIDTALVGFLQAEFSMGAHGAHPF